MGLSRSTLEAQDSPLWCPHSMNLELGLLKHEKYKDLGSLP